MTWRDDDLTPRRKCSDTAGLSLAHHRCLDELGWTAGRLVEPETSSGDTLQMERPAIRPAIRPEESTDPVTSNFTATPPIPSSLSPGQWSGIIALFGCGLVLALGRNDNWASGVALGLAFGTWVLAGLVAYGGMRKGKHS